MNLKTDIYKAYTAIFNDENYPYDLKYEIQKPRSATFVELKIENKSQLSKTTGGAVYSVSVSFAFNTNSEIKSIQDKIDELTNILDAYHYYRDSTKTYFFNALVQGVDMPTDEDWKFKINVELTHEEVE